MGHRRDQPQAQTVRAHGQGLQETDITEHTHNLLEDAVDLLQVLKGVPYCDQNDMNVTKMNGE